MILRSTQPYFERPLYPWLRTHGHFWGEGTNAWCITTAWDETSENSGGGAGIVRNGQSCQCGHWDVWPVMRYVLWIGSVNLTMMVANVGIRIRAINAVSSDHRSRAEQSVDRKTHCRLKKQKPPWGQGKGFDPIIIHFFMLVRIYCVSVASLSNSCLWEKRLGCVPSARTCGWQSTMLQTAHKTYNLLDPK